MAITAKHSYSLCRAWLPHGQLRGIEWVALNPTRNDKTLGSFQICVSGEKAGSWHDFATGDKGSNMISLYCYINPQYKDQYKEAMTKIEEILGYAYKD